MTAVSAAPTVTIGLPVYNGAKYLGEAIESILAQSFTDFELIISDNGSSDTTKQICQEFARCESRIRYHRQPTNIGAAKNYNYLVGLARGEFFKWISHDDYVDPRFVETCLAVMDEHPDVITVAPAMAVVDGRGATIGHLGPPDGDRYWPTDRVKGHRFMIDVLFADTSGLRMAPFEYALHRTELLRRTRLVGSYITSDIVFASELALCGRVVELSEQLSYFRVHDDEGSSGIHFRRYDWSAVQALLDPRVAGRLALAISRRRRYLEFVVAALRAPLSPVDRLRACGTALRPVQFRVGRRFGWGREPTVAAATGR